MFSAWNGKFMSILRQEQLLFVLLFLSNLPYLVQLYLFNGRSGSYLDCLVLLAENTAILLLLAVAVTVLCYFLPWILRWGIGLGSVVLMLADAFALFNYHSIVDEGMLEVIFNTNLAEVREYFVAQGHLLLLAVLAAGIGFPALCCLLRYGLRGLVRRCHYLPGLAVAACLLTALAGRGYAMPDAVAATADPLVHLSFTRLAETVHDAYQEVRSSEYICADLSARPVHLTKNDSTIPYVVFILGESTSRHHMQLYGYPLPDNPQLMQRKAKGELAVFPDVVSPHAGTMAVLKTLFSFYDNDTAGEWYEQDNIFDILHAAGYHTAWLSNQEGSGWYGSVARIYADRCDEGRFTSHSSHTIDLSERHDGEVLPLLDDALTRTEQKNFLVVHLMGAHEDFKRRYPSSFNVFEAEDETGDYTADERQMRAEYDNALLYNDHIVDEIIRRFEAEDAVVIYLSDHGEEVYDLRPTCGHGDETSAWQREIPFMVWTSASFRDRHPADWQRIKSAEQRPYMTDEMIHALLGLMRIETDGYRSDYDLWSSGFVPRERYLKNRKPYEESGE